MPEKETDEKGKGNKARFQEDNLKAEIEKLKEKNAELEKRIERLEKNQRGGRRYA